MLTAFLVTWNWRELELLLAGLLLLVLACGAAFLLAEANKLATWGVGALLVTIQPALLLLLVLLPWLTELGSNGAAPGVRVLRG